jgi:hypothetical protein
VPLKITLQNAFGPWRAPCRHHRRRTLDEAGKLGLAGVEAGEAAAGNNRSKTPLSNQKQAWRLNNYLSFSEENKL